MNKRDVFIFWDAENCRVSRNANVIDVIERLKNYILNEMIPSSHNQLWVSKIYQYLHREPNNHCHLLTHQDRSLQKIAEVEIKSFPKTADISIIEDMYDLLFDYFDHPIKPIVVLISSDYDFSRAINRLQRHDFDFCLICSKLTTSEALMRTEKIYSAFWEDITGEILPPAKTTISTASGKPQANQKKKPGKSSANKQLAPQNTVSSTLPLPLPLPELEIQIDSGIAQYLERYKKQLIEDSLRVQFGDNFTSFSISVNPSLIQLFCAPQIKEACKKFLQIQFISKINIEVATLFWEKEYFELLEKCYLQKSPVCTMIEERNCCLDFVTRPHHFEIFIAGETKVQDVCRFLKYELNPISQEIFTEPNKNLPFQNNRSMVEIIAERLSTQALSAYSVDLKVIFKENKPKGLNLNGFIIKTHQSNSNFVAECMKWLFKQTEEESKQLNDPEREISTVYRFDRCENPHKFLFLSMNTHIANMISSKFNIKVRTKTIEEEIKSDEGGSFNFEFNMTGNVASIAKAEIALDQLQSSEIVSQTLSYSGIDEDLYFHLWDYCNSYRNSKKFKIVPIKVSKKDGVDPNENTKLVFDLVFIQLKPSFGEFMSNKSLTILILGVQEFEEKIENIKNTIDALKNSFTAVCKTLSTLEMGKIYQQITNYPEVEAILNQQNDLNVITKLLKTRKLNSFNELWKELKLYFYSEQKTREKGAELYGFKKLAHSFDLIALRLDQEKNTIVIKGNQEAIGEFEKHIGLAEIVEVIQLRTDSLLFKVLGLEYYKTHLMNLLNGVCSEGATIKLLIEHEINDTEYTNEEQLNDNDNNAMMKKICQLNALSNQNSIELKISIMNIISQMEQSISVLEKSQIFATVDYLNNLQLQFNQEFHVVFEIQESNEENQGSAVKLIGFQDNITLALNELEVMIFNDLVQDVIHLPYEVPDDFLISLLSAHELFVIEKTNDCTIIVGSTSPCTQNNIQEFRLIFA